MKAPLLATWFGVALLLVWFVMYSIQEQQERFQQTRIAWLITKLDDNEPLWREWATEKLVASGLPALAPVRAALAEDFPPARPDGFHEVINRLAIYEPGGGEYTNGLKLHLQADADAIRPGDMVTFTTRLCNLEDEPLLFSSRQLAFFQDGRAFRRVPEPCAEGNNLELAPLTELPQVVGGMMMIRRRIYYIRVPQTDSIPARSSLPFTMTAHLIQENGQRYFQFGDDKTRRLEVPASGVARFRMVYTTEATEGDLAGDHFVVWTGTARSNDVLIRILPAQRDYLPPSQSNPPPGPGQVVFVPGK
jgi:hypothetical protein